MEKNEYTDKNIKSLDILDHIRLRSNAYLSDLGIQGQFYIIKEILDNSIDELENCSYDNLKLDISLVFDKDKNEYLYIIEDNGRGIPLNKVKVSFTSGNTSGKFDTKTFRSSSGLLGIGAKVSVALSTISRIFAYREDRIKELMVEYGKKFDITEYKTKKMKERKHGTFTVFKLDKRVFIEVDRWINGEYEILTNYLKKLNIFHNKYQIRMRVLDNSDLVRGIKELKLNEIIRELDNSEVIEVFDSNDFDNQKYLEEYFGINNNDTSEYKVNGSYEELDIEMSLLVNLSNRGYSNILEDKNKITFINNLLMNDNESYHIKLLKKYLKEKINKKISNKDMREFFNKSYILPIFFTINIKFNGAQFVGTTKHSFRDNNFKIPYLAILNEKIKPRMVNLIYEGIEKHITIQYNKFKNSGLVIKNEKKLLLELERFTKYDDCMTKDSSEAELFLVEGESARSTDGRNEQCQALYTLGGKTLNSLLSQGKEEASLGKIKDNAIFRDIIKILNIVPGSNDLSGLRFNKILIMTDADTHGYHIASILIGNFMIISPKLIEDGYIYVVISPLYNIKIPKIKDTLYLKSEDELIETLTKHIYNKKFRLYNQNQVSRIPYEELVKVISEIMDIGNILTNISSEIKIPGRLVEALYKIPNILLRDELTNRDLNKLKKSLNNEEIFYEKEDHILIICDGLIDYIIPLRSFNKIYDRITLLLKGINIQEYNFDIAFSDDKFNTKFKYSIFEIYQLLNKLKDSTDISRNKGLGSLDSIDREVTCLNQETRIVKRISNMGDINIIYGLLGNDPEYRKNRLM